MWSLLKRAFSSCRAAISSVRLWLMYSRPEETQSRQFLISSRGADLLRNPVNQDMGRKIKISFSSSEKDSAFSFLHDLGFIPTCVGASCNVTLVGPGDVQTDQVNEFLGNLTLTGCSADSSSGAVERFFRSSGVSTTITTTTTLAILFLWTW